MSTSPIFFLLIYSFITVSSVASIFFLTNIIRMIWKNERQEKVQFSLILKYYFWMLLMMSTLMFIHTTTVLIIWRNDLKLPIAPFFWSGNFDSAFMTVIPFTALALTLDRCLILKLKHKYSSKKVSLLFRASILVNIIIGTANFVMYILFRQSEFPEGCVATGCLVTHPAQLVYGYSKTVGVVLSTSAGIVFFIITARLKKKKPQIGTKVKIIAEAIVLRAVIFGILCDFIPHVLNSVWTSMDSDNPLKYIGPFSRIIMAGDLLLNSTINWLVFARASKNNPMVQVTITTRSF